MKKAAWVIPSFIEGSGGYRTIFQHINEMAQEYECHVYVYDSGDYRNSKEVSAAAETFYGRCDCRIHLGYDIPAGNEYAMIFATSWLTAETVYMYGGCAKKVYFVQDYEPLFYPAGDYYLRAAGTYELGFYHITIGRWLAKKIHQNHRARVMNFDFCADSSVYNNSDSKEKENAVCFIYQPDKPRRGTQLGLEALRLIKQIDPELTIYLYGSDIKCRLPFEHINLGIISPQQCSDLYKRCKAGLCISASNPSRIPFEMMACGLPVVDVYMENNLYDYENSGVVLAQCRPEALAQAVLDICKDLKKRNQLIENGLQFMEQRDIKYGMGQFMRAVREIESGSGSGCPVNNPKVSYHGEPVTASEAMAAFKREMFLREQKDGMTVSERLKRNIWIRRIPGIKKIKKMLKGDRL